MIARALLVVFVAACCARPHAVRFANAPVVTEVADRGDTPTPPAARKLALDLYHFRGYVSRRITRALAVKGSQRSLGVNALDEVPDSTWFTNRIGMRDLSLDEVRRGPSEIGSPEQHLPFTILSTKVGGASVGFVMKDARGVKFVLKFEDPGMPELETAADAITGRLLWAIGYNVPEDHVVYVKRDDLVLAPDAKIKDTFGRARKLTRADLDARLAKLDVGPDGKLRGLASRILPGTWLGGHPDEGVRTDDPNDRIPHERRRELRGAKPIFAWLDHVDVKEDNTLDMWVEDNGRHYVKHYWIDFGKSLGVMATTGHNPRASYSYGKDVADMAHSFVTLGFGSKPWDDRVAPKLRGVGMFDAATFTPSAWKPNSPSYLALHLTDDVDGFWAAKLAMRFTREQLRAAVEQGRLSDPAAVDYLVDTLVERQRITARYYFARVAPLDRFAIEGDALCFDDLALTYQLETAATTYELATTNRAGASLATQQVRATRSGRTCTAVPLASDADGYTIARIRVLRGGAERELFVHLARRDGGTHVIGVWRP